MDLFVEPFDPMCQRRPADITIYREMAAVEETTPNQYVIDNEGTYNRENGHFLCDECYIKAGQPSSPTGWKCP